MSKDDFTGQIIHLGAGRFGKVNLEERNCARVAVKTVWAPNCDFKEVFKEVDILSNLFHDHIIRYHGVEQKGSEIKIVMEYAEGGTLEEAIPDLNWNDKKRITAEIAEGLAYLHAKGIVHRDVKSTNILLTKHKVAKLCDFGSATLMDAAMSVSSRSRMGTRRWMAPELLNAIPNYTDKSDIFALGVVMKSMCAAGDIPPDFNKLMLSCLDETPANRPDADTFKDFLGIVKQQRIERKAIAHGMSLHEPEHIPTSEIINDMTKLLNALQQRDSNAQFIVGVKFFLGHELPDDRIMALELLQGEIGEGSIVAQHDIAALCCDKIPLGKKKALEWYLRAADQDHSMALHFIGLAYYSGTVVQQDSVKAMEWVQRAANTGFAVAQAVLGDMYMEGSDRDVGMAIEWWRKAAINGNPRAQNVLGILYYDGNAVPRDPKEAAEWLWMAVEQEEADSQFWLSGLYLFGDGVPQDFGEAIRLIKSSANQGFPHAQMSLGLFFKSDLNSVEGCLKAAHQLAEQGDAFAQFYLAKAYWDGKDIAQDAVKSMDLLQKSADQGFARAEHNLGLCYYNGDGVSPNHSLAMDWLTKASDHGFIESNIVLSKIERMRP